MMKIIPSLLFLFFMGAMAQDSMELFQKAGTPQVLVVDVTFIMDSSEAAQSLQKHVQQREEQIETEINLAEKRIRFDEEKLLENQESMKPEQFKKRRQDLEKKVESERRKIQKLKRDLRIKHEDKLEQLKGEVMRIITEMAKDASATLVVDKSVVILMDKNFDITEDVLEQLDKDISRMELDD